jgi:hypothetical protein
VARIRLEPPGALLFWFSLFNEETKGQKTKQKKM